MIVSSGIYKITNLINGKFYIGSTNNIARRKREHLSRGVPKGNSIIKAAILKYGRNNFDISILEECPVEILITREQYYMDLLKPEYNIRKEANSNRGMILPERQIQHLRTVNIGRKYPGRGNKKVILTNVEGQVLREFSSVKEAGQIIMVDPSNISRCCNGITKTCKGYIFKYSTNGIKM